jgi:redox-sensing transcriptional repressor
LDKKNVPIAVIKRLPRYFRYLGDLIKNDVLKISSSELSKKMELTASQIRQDLNCFGGFGQQGYGYNVLSLYNEIGTILGVDKSYKAIVIGVGNLGNAIANNVNFEKRGVKLIGLFDVSPLAVGTTCNNIQVMHMNDLEKFCKEKKPDIAILTLPKKEAPSVFERLIKAKVKGFWNFSNMELSARNGITIENVHLGDSLMTLCYSIKTNL